MKPGYEFVWDDIPRRIKKGTFLQVGAIWNGSFSGTDSEELFNENLVTQPDDWFYRNNSIEYKLNRHGYRTVEFDTVDWANSIVIFGCSNVFGTGVREEDTLSSQLSVLTNTPVINLGIGASSIEYSLYNSIILKEHKPLPKAVIHVYSSLGRTTYYNRKNVVHHGSWNVKKDSYMDLYSTDPTHGLVHGLMAQMISRQLFSGTKYYETSFFDDTVNKLNIPSPIWLDQARDLSHPGRQTLGKLAEQITLSLDL